MHLQAKTLIKFCRYRYSKHRAGERLDTLAKMNESNTFIKVFVIFMTLSDSAEWVYYMQHAKCLSKCLARYSSQEH